MANGSGNSKIDVGEWRSNSSKSDEGIPPLGKNAFTCSCSPCKAVFRETAHWTSTKKEANQNIPIKLGDRVLVRQNHPGIVKYIGDLDSKYTDDRIYVGVKLDDPVGEHDGLYCNKRFFKCPDMHGTIVPIEQVHILTPRDGREIKIQTRFFSMPEMADLESLLCIASNPDQRLSRTISDGQLISGKSTPLKNTEFVEDIEVQMKPSLDDEGINRSAVFICDNPGSIAASIAHTKSGSDIQAMLLKKLSSGGSVDTKDEQGKDVQAMDATPKESKRVKSASRASKGGSLSGQRHYSVSATSIRSLQYTQAGSLVASRSASSTLTTKKSGEHAPSKQVTSNHPAEDDVQKTTIQQHGGAADPSGTPASAPKLAFMAEPLNIGTSHSEPVINQSLKVVALDQRNSFTWRLLSTLPTNKSTASSPDNAMIDAKLFGELMKERGDDGKAWIKSHTIQKLQTAQERGKVEVEWQQYLDKLEESGQFSQKFSTIKALQKEAGKYHQMTNELEEECRSVTTCHSTHHQELEKIRDEIKNIDKDTQNVLEKVKSSPLFGTTCQALAMFGYDWKDIEAYFV